jgi:hypothetical protein
MCKYYIIFNGFNKAPGPYGLLTGAIL